MSADTTLWLLAIGLEGLVLALLLRRKISRLLPVFTLYIAWTIVSDVTMLALSRWNAPGSYVRFFAVEMPLDAMLQFAVLVELGWSVLRPVRALLPRTAIFALGIILLLVCGVIWPITGISSMPGLTPEWRLLIQLQQTSSILRIVFFLVLALFSQLLAIGWRNRELQVATGLGFYSLVSLGGLLIQIHQVSMIQFHTADRFVRIGYFCCLLYWTASFVRKEAPRGEFSPKMQKFLLALAGTAQANRIALEEARKASQRR